MSFVACQTFDSSSLGAIFSLTFKKGEEEMPSFLIVNQGRHIIECYINPTDDILSDANAHVRKSKGKENLDERFLSLF